MTKRGAVLAVAVLLVGGCSGAKGSESATSSSSKPSVSASASQSQSQSLDDTAYLTRVRATVTGGSDANLVSMAKLACTQMTAGATPLDAASTLVDEGFSTADAAAIATAATQTYCKQFAPSS